MRSFGGRFLLAAILLVSCVPCGKAQSPRKPITDRELMALVAGGAVSEDIAAEIDSRGLAFHPNDSYRSLIASAGGEAAVLEALTKGKFLDGSGQTEIDKSNEYLGHLAKAGKLISGKQFEEAATELVAAIQVDDSPEAGFVMGGLLSAQERWPQAEPVALRAVHIEESLHGKEDPKVITPLSFLCNVYGGSNQPDKAESCDERLIPIMEAKFGKDSARLGPPLKEEAEALRKLGRVDEAEKVEQRIQAIQTGAGQPAGAPSAQLPTN